MAEVPRSRRVVRFGAFQCDLATGELCKNGTRLYLPDQPLRVLARLLERPGELVTRKELHECLWPGQEYGLFDEGLNTAVNKLRTTLNDRAGKPRFIETVPRRGYRFIAPVEIEGEGQGSVPANGNSKAQVAELVVALARDTDGGVALDLPGHIQGEAGAGLNRQIDGGLTQPLRRILAGLVVAAALVYALYRAARLEPAPPAALQFTRVTGSGDVQHADISPDGKYVAYMRETGGNQSLWFRQLATGSEVQIATLGSDVCTGLAFSPEGSYVYFVRKSPLSPAGDLYQVPSLGGTPGKMLAGISSRPAFSPDGRRLAFVRNTTSGEAGLWTASLDGSGERLLASHTRPEGTGWDHVAWSSDGKTLAFVQQGPEPILTTIAAAGGKARPVVGTRWRDLRDLTWLRGSRQLLVAGSPLGASGPLAAAQLYEVRVDRGEARQITHDTSNYTGVRVTADGKTLVAVQNQILAAIQVATPGKESEARWLSAGSQNLDGRWGLSWTPNGEIVYSSTPRRDLWERGGDGSPPRQLTWKDVSSPFLVHPAVSLRGDFIAFDRLDRNGDCSIWRIDMAGGNPKQLTEGTQDRRPAVSPDGRWVVFTRSQGGKSILMKVPSGGGPASRLSNYGANWPSVSLDGKWIACYYSPKQGQPISLAIIPFAGGQPARIFPLPAGQHFPLLWTPDRRAISFVGSVNGVANIWEQPLAGGPPEPVTRFTSGRILYFDWSRDGRLALSRATDQTDAVLIRNFN